jgi:hypothetical protein
MLGWLKTLFQRPVGLHGAIEGIEAEAERIVGVRTRIRGSLLFGELLEEAGGYAAELDRQGKPEAAAVLRAAIEHVRADWLNGHVPSGLPAGQSLPPPPAPDIPPSPREESGTPAPPGTDAAAPQKRKPGRPRRLTFVPPEGAPPPASGTPPTT